MLHFVSNRPGLKWCAAVVALCASATVANAQTALTEQDRTEIQGLATSYARSLGACAAEEYADLFAPDTGYFASGLRGELIGRGQLIALVRANVTAPIRHRRRWAVSPPRIVPGRDRQAVAPAAPAAPAAAGAPRPTPTVVIEATPTGARGKADLGNAGSYEDEYVKTRQRLALQVAHGHDSPGGCRGPVGQGCLDHPAPRRQRPGTVRRRVHDRRGGWPPFPYVRPRDPRVGRRHQGEVVPEGQRRGRYDDVYVRTSDGGWRFQSRTFVVETPK